MTDAASATRAFAAANGISGDDLSRLCVVVEEWVANLYEHGGVAPDKTVEITLANDPKGVRILILDPGRAFDPRKDEPGKGLPERGGGGRELTLYSNGRVISITGFLTAVTA